MKYLATGSYTNNHVFSEVEFTGPDVRLDLEKNMVLYILEEKIMSKIHFCDEILL